jgi:lantibiotic modifying enzyme
MAHPRLIGLLETLDVKFDSQYFKETSIDPSFASGHSGAAMFYGYYYSLTKDKKLQTKCENLIERLIDYISKYEVSFTLCDGLAGLCWCIQHLIANDVIDASESILDDLDELIAKFAITQLKLGNYDLLHGGVGCGLYLLGRKNCAEYVNEIVVALNESSHRDNSGQYWIDDYSNYPVIKKCANFGMAHGLPSIISFLAKVSIRNKLELAKEMVRDASNYLISKSNLEQYVGSHFPRYYIENDPNPKQISRLAWCYGDLGAAVSLLHASKALADNDLRKQMLDILISSTNRRSFEETLVNDGGICHGIAGVAHIYNRLYLDFSDKVFEEAKNFWFDRLEVYIDNCGGMKSFKYFDVIKNEFSPSTNFLTGSAGAGLALISQIDNTVTPSWDEFLLLS